MTRRSQSLAEYPPAPSPDTPLYLLEGSPMGNLSYDNGYGNAHSSNAGPSSHDLWIKSDAVEHLVHLLMDIDGPTVGWFISTLSSSPWCGCSPVMNSRSSARPLLLYLTLIPHKIEGQRAAPARFHQLNWWIYQPYWWIFRPRLICHSGENRSPATTDQDINLSIPGLNVLSIPASTVVSIL